MDDDGTDIIKKGVHCPFVLMSLKEDASLRDKSPRAKRQTKQRVEGELSI